MPQISSVSSVDARVRTQERADSRRAEDRRDDERRADRRDEARVDDRRHEGRGRRVDRHA